MNNEGLIYGYFKRKINNSKHFGEQTLILNRNLFIPSFSNR